MDALSSWSLSASAPVAAAWPIAQPALPVPVASAPTYAMDGFQRSALPGFLQPAYGAPAAFPGFDPLVSQMQQQLAALAAEIEALIRTLVAPVGPVAPVPYVPAPAPAPAPMPTPPPSGVKRAADFVISSFNVLGSSHTAPGGNKPGMRSGVTRIHDAIKLLKSHDVDVVGFQEFQRDQFLEFQKVAGSEYGVYPGFQLGKPEVVNSLAWRKDTWDMVKPGYINIPYFDGKPRKMPVVRLRHKETGQEAFFANFHNPASTKTQGNQQKWRDKATDLQIEMVKRLERESGIPVIITGDMNEREEYYNRMTQATDMEASNRGPGGKAPKKMGIDWIFGSTGVSFSGHTVDRGALVQRTTDHPMVVSRARLSGG